MVKPGYRVLATDLDHTLLNASGGVSSTNRMALKRAREAGWELVIASGRRLDSVRQLLRMLDVSAYQVCLNGALVATPNGRQLLNAPIAIDTVLSLFDLAADSNVNLMLNTMSTTYCASGRDAIDVPEYITNVAGKTLLRGRGELSTLLTEHAVYKVAFNSQNHEELIDLAQQVNGTKLANVVWSDTAYVEMTAPGVSKLSGLATVATYSGIGLQHFVACGDYENDIEMLNGTGLGVAMDNALPQVRRSADLVVPNRGADGVGMIINQLLDQQKG